LPAAGIGARADPRHRGRSHNRRVRSDGVHERRGEPSGAGAEPAKAARRLLPHGPRDLVRQIGIWLGFVAGYQICRALAAGDRGGALRHGRSILDLEERLGTLFEPALQRAALDVGDVLVHLADWTYWLSQFAVVTLVLLWVYLRWNDAYYRLRNTLVITNTLGLVVYAAYPAAPPRMYPADGFVDTLARSEVLNHGSALVEFVSNAYAAMPSLHAADALIVGATLAGVASNPVARVVACLWPLWVSFALVVTANHSWLDIAAGAAAAALGAGGAGILERRRQRRLRCPPGAARALPV
jgi:membrane-associated phospholipid phosphatase